MKKYNISLILLTMILFNCNPIKKEKINSKSKDEVTIPKEVKKSEKVFSYGIDISKYQGDEISGINKQKDSITFVICKATQGITYTDPKFGYNWKMIEEKSFLRGAYHFYMSNDQPFAQATNFLNAIASIQKSDIPPIIDFEQGGIDKSQSLESIQAKLKSFISEIEKKLKCKPIIYTSVNAGNTYLNDPFFANYPLWIANYNGKEAPDLPNAWKDKGWLLWQRSDTYKLDGITDDLDIFNGSLQDFNLFIKNSYHE